MIALLAESKTMSSQQVEVNSSIFSAHKPTFEEAADSIMQYISSLTPIEIGEILGISNFLAKKAHALAYEFPHKITGYKAIEAFIGDAYKGLDINSLSSECVGNADNSLRIISSVYGILKPSDIIKPYRCEFNKDICPNKTTPIKLYKSKITIELVNLVKSNKIKDVINLLPGDADKCIDWKIIRAFTSVHKICFQEMTSEGKLKTPIAKHLKELRGKMYRSILKNNLQSFKELISYQSEYFLYSPSDSKPGLPVFIVG